MSATAVSHGAVAPSPWIVRFAPLVPARARVLDLACGTGRHARLFAGRGCQVLAVDRDDVALAGLAGIAGVEAVRVDLEMGTWPLAGSTFDAIVVANYLHRPLFPFLLASLAADGVLLYETFARGHEAYGRPSNPDFLLEPGELLRLTHGRLRVVAYEEGRIDDGARTVVVERIAAVAPGRAQPIPLP